MIRRFAFALISIGILISGCAKLEEVQESRLDIIKRRGELRCGVSGKIPGFSFLASDGNYQGLDVDICKAFAAAIIGDPNKVIYRPLTAPERFTALRTGEIDILSRNTTMNLSRDSIGGNGVSFGPVVFHDGQALMVSKKSKIKTVEELNNKNICVGSGTTTEQNLNDFFEERDIAYTPIKYQDLNQVVAGYLQGRCTAMTSDKSQLAAARSSFRFPKKHIILSQVLSKEPLAPATSGNDEKLTDVVRWTIYALFAAEEYDITMDNIDSKVNLARKNQKMMSLRRLFGIDGRLGEKLGIPNDFVVKIISNTGNYGEIYSRNLGPKSSVKINRGINSNYKNGGIQISPPFK